MKELSRKEILEKAKFLGSMLNAGSLYWIIFNSKEDNTEQALFEIAQQVNTSKMTKKGTLRTVGSELVELALKLYPDAKLGDAYVKTID